MNSTVLTFKNYMYIILVLGRDQSPITGQVPLHPVVTAAGIVLGHTLGQGQGHAIVNEEEVEVGAMAEIKHLLLNIYSF